MTARTPVACLVTARLRHHADRRAHYLERIATCDHSVPTPRGPGWICGGCGRSRDEITDIEMEEAA